MTDSTRLLGQPGAPGQNTGHGHVFPRPDGVRARCGGLRLGCRSCVADAERKRQLAAATVQVDPVLLMYAFRYALGRMTYAVGDVADALIANVERLRPDWRRQIIRDVEEAIAERRGGQIIDTERWRGVAEVMAAAERGELRYSDLPLGPGEDDVEVWVPPANDCMHHRPDEPCPHCGSALFHQRTRRCGDCGRRP